jgi:ribosomal protein L2
MGLISTNYTMLHSACQASVGAGGATAAGSDSAGLAGRRPYSSARMTFHFLQLSGILSN